MTKDGSHRQQTQVMLGVTLICPEKSFMPFLDEDLREVRGFC